MLELCVLKSAAICKAAQKRLSRKVAQKGEDIFVEHVQLMVHKVVEDEEEKARSVITQAEEKWAQEAAKAAECVAIDSWKTERKVKKNVKDLVKAEKLARLALLIDMYLWLIILILYHWAWCVIELTTKPERFCGKWCEAKSEVNL